MKKLGEELIFISQINKDGSGVKDMSDKTNTELDKIEFNLIHLSITLGTFIAHGFHSYVVKIK